MWQRGLLAVLCGSLGACIAAQERGGEDAGVGSEPAAAGKDDCPSCDEECTDVPPDDTYTCGEQVGWGKCGEPWMDGYCERSCGLCPGIGDSTCDRCPISAQLIDPEASDEARRLMEVLVRMHGNAILSGQQGRAEADAMAALTGHAPAVVGFDLMDYSPSRVEHGASSDEVDQALDWALNERGIVTFAWHWNAPADLVDSTSQPWWKGFYTDATTFDFERAMYERDSKERQLVLRDIDAIAVQLQRLEDAGVPVLWRPIHEASGGWFWWGAHGPQPYLALWRLLYDRLVNHHQIHNLVWVWNGQHRDWYPGDAYVDIIAEDIYDTERDYEPQEAAYLDAKSTTDTPKLVALSETGALLDPARLRESRARWSWFMLWSGEFATTQTWNEDAMKVAVYGSDFVITLDELPPLR